ncbi:Citrate synthase 2 [Andreprevotia sp. IGB-42]|uniref:citrate synthase n=1 Tax=Andreprevotia sp. IGB-42 TaxID=2497473 RepID=UPI0013574FB7|nr:citrate synthase [Andreprevotia sp. IGB-42]KAF0812897.1 Citrate synthase 2 [Andreprevotia sp. IGB-42]
MAWISTAEALAMLDVKAQTLYANVSRGKIRAKADPADPRRSLYFHDDVAQLAGGSAGRRKVEKVAADAIDWGDPVLPSAISTVAQGCLWFRGQNAVKLAADHDLEYVASLLWGGGTIAVSAPLPAECVAAAARPEPDALCRAMTAMAMRSASDLPSYGRASAALRLEAPHVLLTLFCAVLQSTPDIDTPDLAGWIARRWQRPNASAAIRCALVLLADHELNASTFATRVAISTGASLSAGVLAGLAAASGPLHGSASLAITRLLEAINHEEKPAALTRWLRQGQGLPGFGHRLYPDGDPRAVILLDALTLPPIYAALAQDADRLVGERPNIDFALAALARIHDLPPDAPMLLFVLARCVGWLAHAMEQAQAARLIRPRARYVGPPLQSDL